MNQPGLHISKYACSEQHSVVGRRRGRLLLLLSFLATKVKTGDVLS